MDLKLKLSLDHLHEFKVLMLSKFKVRYYNPYHSPGATILNPRFVFRIRALIFNGYTMIGDEVKII